MSVQSEINRITTAVASAYDAVDDIGGTLPASTVVGNLASAISSIADSVTENYTNVSSASAKTKVLHGSSFYQKIVPDDGYLISSVTVTMGGVDITSQVFSGDTGSSGGGTTPTGTLSISQNGTYDVTQYASAEVDVPAEGITPTGTVSITQNGTVDVTNYASASVNVPNSYSASDEGKVVDGGALVSQGSDTVTANGTYDTTLISSLLVNVASGGSSVETGTVIPASASTTLSFTTGLSTITGILIMPINTPLTSSRTQAAMICLPNGSFYKAISIHTNSGGTGWVSPSVYTANRFTKSGNTVTVTGAYSFRPAVGYVWYAW